MILSRACVPPQARQADLQFNQLCGIRSESAATLQRSMSDRQVPAFQRRVRKQMQTQDFIRLLEVEFSRLAKVGG
tara:strand:- start:26 stop:250 length:225 start_codon:yes stop_codon:yes gene_type:complete